MAEKEEMGTKEDINQKIVSKCLAEEKQQLLRMSEISLWLDSYDDIFSDFDPRPYSQRALSDDFLNEAKKASKEKTSGQIELKFLVPVTMRNLERESTIKKRLREHFKRHYNLLHQEIAKIKKLGVVYAAIGFAMMLSVFFMGRLDLPETLVEILTIFFEPGGWFMMWFGLDQLFYTAKDKQPDIEFYEKMTKCEIIFTPY